MKKTIRLTEGDLHRIIKGSVKKILKENDDIPFQISVPFEDYKHKDYPIEKLSDSDKRVYEACLRVIDEKRKSNAALYEVLEEMPADGLSLSEAEQVCSITDNYYSGSRMIFSGPSGEYNDTVDYRIVRLLQQHKNGQ